MYYDEHGYDEHGYGGHAFRLHLVDVPDALIEAAFTPFTCDCSANMGI